jgi:hypothetical protein
MGEPSLQYFIIGWLMCSWFCCIAFGGTLLLSSLLELPL